MSNAGSGSYNTTYERTMAAFDKLPIELRQRLANAVDEWAVQPVLSAYRAEIKRGRWPSDAVAYCLRMLDRWDDEERLEHRYRIMRGKRDGTGYYEGRLRNKSACLAEAKAYFGL